MKVEVKVLGGLAVDHHVSGQYDASCPGELLRILDANSPGIVRDVMVQGYCLIVGGEEVTKSTIGLPFFERDVVLCPRVGGRVPSAAAIYDAFIAYIVSIGISYVVNQLFPVKFDEVKAQDGGKVSEYFNGAVNTSSVHSVVPLCYGGPIRVGSKVISASVFTRDLADRIVKADEIAYADNVRAVMENVLLRGLANTSFDPTLTLPRDQAALLTSSIQTEDLPGVVDVLVTFDGSIPPAGIAGTSGAIFINVPDLSIIDPSLGVGGPLPPYFLDNAGNLTHLNQASATYPALTTEISQALSAGADSTKTGVFRYKTVLFDDADGHFPVGTGTESAGPTGPARIDIATIYHLPVPPTQFSVDILLVSRGKTFVARSSLNRDAAYYGPVGVSSTGVSGPQGIAWALVAQETSLASESIVETIDALCEGPIYGYAGGYEESTYINGVPLRSPTTRTLAYKNVETEMRKGTLTQDNFPRVLGPGTGSTFGVNTVLLFKTPISRNVSTLTTDIVDIAVTFSSLFESLSDGAISPRAVDLSIKVNGTNVRGMGTRLHIAGSNTNQFKRAYRITLAQYGPPPYTITVERLTEDATSLFVSDKVTWEGYTEYEADKLYYPHTALVRTVADSKSLGGDLPARAWLIKGREVFVPNGYTPGYQQADGTWVAAVYPGTWDGTLGPVRKWTANPVWIYYDAVTSTRAGVGSPSLPPPPLPELYQISQACDALVSDGKGGMEPRFSCTVYMGDARKAYDVLKDITSVFRGMVYWSGGLARAVYDTIESPVAQFTAANVVDGKFTYSGSERSERYTAVLVQWNDPDNEYKQAIEYVEDRAALLRYGRIERTAVAFGTVSRGQARRAGAYILASSQLEPERVTFVAPLDATYVLPGNVIKVADPNRQTKRGGGRVLSIVQGAGATDSVVELDSSVDITAGSTTISLLSGGTALIDAPVTDATGTSNFLHIASATDVTGVLPGSIWTVSTPTVSAKTFRVNRISEQDNDGVAVLYEIQATAYDPNKFAAIDAGFTFSAVAPTLSQPVTFVYPAGAVTVFEPFSQDAATGHTLISVRWEPSPDEHLSRYRVVVTDQAANATVASQETRDGSVTLEVPLNAVYAISVTAISTTGRLSESALASYTVSSGTPSFAQILSGLELTGAGNATVFYGEDAIFSWRLNYINPKSLTTGGPVGSSGLPAWISGYRVRVEDSLGNVVREELVTDTHYAYTLAKSVEDGGPYRNLTLKVSIIDRSGNPAGTEQSLTVSNPPPALPTGVALSGGFRRLILKMDPPQDSDFAGMLVWLSTASGFTPSDATLVYDGASFPLSIETDGTGAALGAGVTYYVRFAAYDRFGTSGVTISSELTAATLQVLATDTSGFGDWAFKLDAADKAWIDSHLALNAVSSTRIESVTAAKVTTGIIQATVDIESQGMIRATNPGVGNYQVRMGFETDGGTDYIFRYGDVVASYYPITMDVAGNASFSGKITVADWNNGITSTAGDAPAAGANASSANQVFNSGFRADGANVFTEPFGTSSISTVAEVYWSPTVATPDQHVISSSPYGVYEVADTAVSDNPATDPLMVPPVDGGWGNNFADIYFSASPDSAANRGYPCTPGVNYEASVYVASNLCRSYLVIAFYDASGAYISEVSTGPQSTILGTVNGVGTAGLTSYDRLVVIGVAPAGAVTAKPRLRKYAKHPTYSDPLLTSDLFVLMPFFGEATAGQTAPSPWSEGGGYPGWTDSTNLRVGPGVNRMVNAGFRNTLEPNHVSIYNTTNGAGIGSAAYYFNYPATWFIPKQNADDIQTLTLNQPDTNATLIMDAWLSPVNTDPAFVARQDASVPCIAGNYYEVSAYVNVHRCAVSIKFAWCYFDTNGAIQYLSDVTDFATGYLDAQATVVPSSAGADRLDRYQRIWTIARAPSVAAGDAFDAAYMLPFIRKHPTTSGQPTSWVFIRQPYWGDALAGQTEPSAWSEGNSFPGQIHSGNAATYLGNGAVDWGTHIGGTGKPAANATVGADSTNLQVGPGVNRMINAGFRNTREPAAVAFWATSGLVDLGSTDALNGSPNWFIPKQTADDIQTLSLYQPGTNDAQVMDLYLSPLNTSIVDAAASVPCIPGQYYEISAYVSVHRCIAEVRFAWYRYDATTSTYIWFSESVDAVNGYLDATNVITYPSLIAPEPLGADRLDRYQRMWTIVRAPSIAAGDTYDAVYLLPIIRKHGTAVGQSNSYLFIRQPYYGDALAGQTEPSAWSETPSTAQSALTTGVTISAGGITVGSGGALKGGQTGYDVGSPGWFLGYSGATHKFSIGNPAGDALLWDGTGLSVIGTIKSSRTATGERMEFNTAGNNRLKFYDASGTEALSIGPSSAVVPGYNGTAVAWVKDTASNAGIVSQGGQVGIYGAGQSAGGSFYNSNGFFPAPQVLLNPTWNSLTSAISSSSGEGALTALLGILAYHCNDTRLVNKTRTLIAPGVTTGVYGADLYGIEHLGGLTLQYHIGLPVTAGGAWDIAPGVAVPVAFPTAFSVIPYFVIGFLTTNGTHTFIGNGSYSGYSNLTTTGCNLYFTEAQAQAQNCAMGYVVIGRCVYDA